MTELTIAMLAMAACVYGTSAAAKLISRRNYRAFRDGLAETALVPRQWLAVVAAVLAGAETGAAGILAASAVLAVTAGVGSVLVATIALGCGILLTSVLTAGVTVVIRNGTHAACACFGARSSRKISGSHLARNVSFLVLQLAGLICNEFRHGRAAPAAAIVAVAAGAVIALLLIRFDDLVELFVPMRRQTVR
jgi:hypothetical protein